MKRKLFSAILFGALLTASTSGLTSCKDYDDDISNLQSQIDKLATADQLSAKVTELQGQIAQAKSDAIDAANAAKQVADNALKAAQDAATKGDVEAAKAAAAAAQKTVDDLKASGVSAAAINAAQEAADKANAAIADAIEKGTPVIEGLNKAIEDLKAAEEEHTKAIDELDKQLNGEGGIAERLAAAEKAIEEGANIDLTELTELIEDFEAKVADILGSAFVMATSLDLYDMAGFNNTLNFYNVLEIENEFPAAMQKATDDAEASAVTGGDKLTFVEGTKRVYNDSLIVRVNPVDAELKAENLCLVNSQGAVLSSDLVEIVSAHRYQGAPLTGGDVRSAEGTNGLWVIKIKANDKLAEKEVAKEFKEATQLDNKYILFALGVSEPDNADRLLVTDYKVDLTYGDAPQAAGYNVTTGSFGTKPYTDFRNRWETNDKNEAVGKDVWKVDYNWVNINKKDKNGVTIVNKEVILTPAKDKNVEDDARSTGKNVFFVKAGERINIVFDQEKAPVAGFYVTLDWRRANESGKSEINAWNTYTYENVAKVDATTGKVFANCTAKLQRGNNGYITIKSLEQFASVGDIIGFRVFAVNLDGSLVDPDGQAFYVGIKGDTEAEKPVELAAQNITVQFNNAQYTAASAADKATMNVTGKFDAEDAFASEDYNAITWSVAHKSGDNNEKANTLTEGTDFSIKYVKLNDEGQEVYFTPGTAPNYFSDITKLEMQILQPTKFVDGATYTVTGDLRYSVGTGSYIVRSVKFDVTKKMPTTMPKDYVISYKAFTSNEVVVPLMADVNEMGSPVVKEGTYTGYGKWVDSNPSGNNEEKAGNGKWGVDLNWASSISSLKVAGIDLGKVYAFPNNADIFGTTTPDGSKVKYLIEKVVAGKGDITTGANANNKLFDAKQEGWTVNKPGIEYSAGNSVKAWVAGNFVDGSARTVKSIYRYQGISCRKAKWQAGNTGIIDDDATESMADNTAEYWYDVEAVAPSIKLMPWSDASLVSYKWIQKCVAKAVSGVSASKWEDDNDYTMPAVGGEIKVDLGRVVVYYNDILKQAGVPMYTAPNAVTDYQTANPYTSVAPYGWSLGELLGNVDANGKGSNWLSFNREGKTGDRTQPLKVKIHTKATYNGQQLTDGIFEFKEFDNTGTNGCKVVLKLKEGAALSDHTEQLCFELVDCFGHVTPVALDFRVSAAPKAAEAANESDGNWFSATSLYRRAK